MTAPAPARDPLAAGLGALAAGVGLGGACITVALLLVQTLERRGGPDGADRDVTGNVLVGGLVAGMAVAALFGWRRSAGVEGIWQRGVVAVLSVFGALMVAFLFTIPARQLAGTAGLAVLGAVLAAVGVMGSRWAAKAGERGGERGGAA